MVNPVVASVGNMELSDILLELLRRGMWSRTVYPCRVSRGLGGNTTRTMIIDGLNLEVSFDLIVP